MRPSGYRKVETPPSSSSSSRESSVVLPKRSAAEESFYRHSTGKPPPPPPPGAGVPFSMGGRIPREELVQSLLRHASAIHQEQQLRAEMAYPQVHRMDTPREVAPLGSGSGPPPPPGAGGVAMPMNMVVPPPPLPPPEMSEILASHNQMRTQLQQMAHHVHEQSNRAMQLEQQLMAQERTRERSREERRHAAVAMFRRESAAHEVAPPFLNQVIGPAAVPPPVPDAGMSSGSQEKRASSAPAEQRPKTQVVERVVERLIERPADIATPGVPDPPPMAPVRYDPPKALSAVMPYTHASDPALARAVAHVVASLAAAPKRAAAETDIEEETQEADQSGSKPIIAKKMRADELQTPKKVARVKKPTTYATMSRFNASELVRRREQRRKAVEERRSERVAVRIAKAEALKIVGKVIQKTKARRLATTARAPAKTARTTPSRAAVVV